MGKSANQKRKILLLERMLIRTDVEHPISMKQMIDELAAQEILAERKSIYADLAELRAVGMQIEFRKAAPSGYFVRNAEVLPPVSEDTREEEALSPVSGHTKEQEEQAPIPELAKAELAGNEIFNGSDRKREDAQEIYLRIKRAALPQLRKRYGEHLTLLNEEEKYVVAVVQDVADRQFWGWLVSNGNAIRPQKPKDVVKEYKKTLKKILESYK